MQTSNLPHLSGTSGNSSQTSPFARLRRTAHSTEQTLFLQRFRTLLAKRQQQIAQSATVDWRRRLIDKALYSTYRDCLGLDIGDEVREILRQDQGNSVS